MKKVLFFTVLTVCLAVTASAQNQKQAVEVKETYGLPFEVGRYWIYDYVSEEQDPNGNAEVAVGENGEKVKVNRVNAKASIEIEEVTGKDNLIVAIMSGDGFGMEWAPPKSLSFFWLLDENTGHFINASAEVKERCLLGDRNVLNNSPTLVLPLKVGDKWGEEPPVPRDDGWYQWHVEGMESIKVPLGTYTCFRIAYRTVPDHELIWFAPGLGIVKRQYRHHGTIISTDYELIEYGLRQK